MSGAPDPKSRSLARGERRYRRKVASPKQWQAIIEAKRGPCRLLDYLGRCGFAVEYHHIVPRSQGGDDVAENVAPVCRLHHAFLTSGAEAHLTAFAASLTPEERAYVIGKLGEGGIERLFGATQ